MFKYTLQADQSIKIETDTNHPVLIGHFAALEDGYRYFWPVLQPGAWSREFLLELATELERLNAAWDKEVMETLAKLNSVTM